MNIMNKVLMMLCILSVSKHVHSSGLNLDYECEITAEFAASENSTVGLKLIAASAGGDMENVLALLKKDVDPNFIDAEMMTPLVWASRCGHFDVVKLLINYGADVNQSVSYRKGVQYSYENSSALIWASSNNQVEIVRFLLSKGADSTRNECVFQVDAQEMQHFISVGRNASSVTQNEEILLLLEEQSKLVGERPM